MCINVIDHKKVHPKIPFTTLVLKYIYAIFSNSMTCIILSQIYSIYSSFSLFVEFLKMIAKNYTCDYNFWGA
jgi:hypothetical protein